MKKIMAVAMCIAFLSMSLVAFAGEVVVRGSAARADIVSAYLSEKGASTKVEHTKEDVMGYLKGKPWPGVQVSTETNSDVFVPVSDNVVKKGVLCKDQKALLRSLISVSDFEGNADVKISPAESDCCPECGMGKWLLAKDALVTGKQRDLYGSAVDLVSIEDGFKPWGCVASKIWVDPSRGPRAEVVVYNGKANPTALNRSIDRATNSLAPKLHQYKDKPGGFICDYELICN